MDEYETIITSKLPYFDIFYLKNFQNYKSIIKLFIHYQKKSKLQSKPITSPTLITNKKVTKKNKNIAGI